MAALAYAWFFCPYKRRASGLTPDPKPKVYCAMDDFTSQINADGGAWSECEVLGAQAIVKVKASDATLTTIAGTANFQRIPNHWTLTDSLADLTAGQKTVLNTKLLALGYLQAEIDAAAGGDWGTKTLDDLLTFACTRRLTPRYDTPTDTVVWNGVQRACNPPAQADAAVL